MKKSKFLYLPVEVKPRELDAKLLLAAEACSRGYSVIVGTKVINKLMKQMPKGVYFYKDSQSPLFKWFEYLNEIGNKVVVHDEEGLVQQSDDDYLNRRVMFDTIKYVHIFFCWGVHQASLVHKAKECFRADVQVDVTGHPRFDLLRDPIKGYNLPNKKRDCRVILVNTKLAECNHRNGESGWLDILIRYNMLHSDNCLPLRLDQIEYKKNLFSHYRDLIARLSVCYPRDRIVVRPHPSEKISTWNQFAADLPNVDVTNEGNIGYWLNLSDIVVHTGCTTAIEAYASGLPVVAFKPIHDKRFEIQLPDSISIVAESTDHCVAVVGRLLGGSSDYVKKSDQFCQLLKPHIENINGGLSYKKIIESIDNLDVDARSLSAFVRVKWRVRDFLSSIKPNFTKRPVDNYKDISISEIQESLVNICSASDITQPKVSKLKKNVYLISSVD